MKRTQVLLLLAAVSVLLGACAPRAFVPSELDPNAGRRPVNVGQAPEDYDRPPPVVPPPDGGWDIGHPADPVVPADPVDPPVGPVDPVDPPIEPPVEPPADECRTVELPDPAPIDRIVKCPGEPADLEPNPGQP